MLRHCVALAFLLLLASTAQAQSPHVRLEGPTGSGSGVIIPGPDNHPIIASCAHPFKSRGEKVTITVNRNKQLKGIVLAHDPELDLALIGNTEDSLPNRWVQLCDEAPEDGEVTLIGYGKGQFHEKKGKISRRETTTVDGVERELIRYYVAARPGDSGGAVIYKGKMAGIQCAGHKSGDTSWFIPCDSVRVIIGDYEHWQKTTPEWKRNLQLSGRLP
jgi:S1-C subfamily serine protease